VASRDDRGFGVNHGIDDSARRKLGEGDVGGGENAGVPNTDKLTARGPGE